MKKMSAARAKAIKTPGRHQADETLYLHVSKTGAKSWVQRLVVNGQRHDIGLGGLKLVSLAEARELAYENRKLARRGVDPFAEKRKPKVPTFRDASEKTFESLRPRWRNSTTARNWTQSLTKHAYPVIGDVPIDQIGREQILQILVPIWSKTPEVSRRVKQRIHATLKWGMAHGHTDLNAVDLVAGAFACHAESARAFSCTGLQANPAGDPNDSGLARIIVRKTLLAVHDFNSRTRRRNKGSSMA